MGLRQDLSDALKQAMKNKDTARLGTLRLINAAIKDQDIVLRGNGSDEGVGDTDILAILGKMSKQRLESAKAYEEGGRIDLAEKEREEITVIETFLPKQLDNAEVNAAIESAISETGAETIRDMGKVMGQLKARYAGQMDFGAVGAQIKERLSAAG